MENHIYTNYSRVETAAKFLKFSLFLIFGAVLSLSAANIARAAIFTVDRTDDANVSACTEAANDCTLRGAIAAANAAASDDLINFSGAMSQQFVLTNGELTIENNGTLTISGTDGVSGAIDGNNQTRVLFINNSANVTINNLNITRGNNTAFPLGGGGIRNLGTLSLNNSMVSGNTASSNGGGIYNEGILNIVSSTVKNNLASTSGGGILNIRGTVNITSSTINNNTSGSTGGGGGGIGDSSGTMTIRNSTIYGNFGNNGGGISAGARLSIYDSTISSNRVFPSSGVGGGILANNAFVSLRNTIVANNFAPNGTDFAGTLNSLGYNLIGNASQVSITGITTGNILGQDPRLGNLQNNGGATQTLKLMPGSPAIDAADPNNFPAEDQRGVPRPADGDGNRSSLPDIGAYEVETANNFVVTKTADTNDGVCDSDCSLREAVAAANASPGSDTISFDPNVFGSPQTITLTGGDLRIADNGTLNVNGPGMSLLTISGNMNSRIFSVVYLAGFTASDLTITNGVAVGSIPERNGLGGGIYTEGTVELNRVTVKNCLSSGLYNFGLFTTTINSSTFSGNQGSDGGAIRNLRSVPLIISNTTIVNNSAVNGGGIYSSGGLTLTDSLLRNNTAGDSGGGIYGAGISLTNTTVNNNSAVNEGGGIRTNGSGLTILNSSFGGNSASSGGAITSYGSMTLTNSTVENNLARFGGGITKYSSDAAGITGSTISNNTASENSGGIFNLGGAMTLVNSTVSGNSAVQDGGGINNFATLNLVNVTVAKNAASNGGGILNVPGTVNARNTIIADNSSDDFFGKLNSQGYNLIENTANATLTATAPGPIITGQDPQLLPLGNYGGTTKTHALKPTSPAIDAGLLTTNTATAVDQRGMPRPFDFPNIPNASGGDGSDIGAFERQANDRSFRTPFDFDGDGKADISVFRPGTGVWYLNQSQNGFTAAQFGVSNDKLVPADYDGDGKTDLAVYRNGTWYLQRSSAGFTGISFGAPDDIPQPADFDGDGKADLAVYRPSNGTWYVLNLVNNQFYAVQFGAVGDKPVVGDYNGDGKADYAVFRPSNGTWYIARPTGTPSQNFDSIQFGDASDKPVPADYDGDGKTDVAVYRPSNGSWYLQRSTAGFAAVQFGISTDLPAPADYDGDGKADIAVYRSGTWYVNRTTAGFTGIQFGTATDKPVPNAFIP